MKTKKLLLIAAALLTMMGLASCNKTENLIVGTWQATGGELIDPDPGDELHVIGTLWTFNSDKSCSITADGRTHKGTYTVDEDHLIITYQATEGGWTVENVAEFDVTEIDKTKMNVEGTMKVNYQGSPLSSFNVKISYKKL